jgi:regulator of G-protein signaling 3/regulator of G-protein signaling
VLNTANVIVLLCLIPFHFLFLLQNKNDLMSLTKVLQNPIALRYFRAFLVKEFSEENLDFVLEVQKFRTLTDPSQISLQAKQIYHKYMTNSESDSALNVSGLVLKEIELKLPVAENTIFEPAYQQIFLLMENDSFKRFLEGPMFARLQARLAKLGVEEAPSPNM